MKFETILFGLFVLATLVLGYYMGYELSVAKEKTNANAVECIKQDGVGKNKSNATWCRFEK